jgi:hypothetical protein
LLFVAVEFAPHDDGVFEVAEEFVHAGYLSRMVRFTER